RQHRVVHADPAANPAVDRMMLTQAGQRARRPNAIGRRVQPKPKQDARIGRRPTRRLATRLDAVVKHLKVQAFHEGPHRPHRMVFHHQALKVDQLKTSLPTLRLPNTNVHQMLQIHPDSESRNITKKMTDPTKQSILLCVATWIASLALAMTTRENRRKHVC